MKVELWNLEIFGVIVFGKTGIVYRQQAGGSLCDHPEAEGSFIPLVNPGTSLRASLGDYLENVTPGNFTSADARHVDKELADWRGEDSWPVIWVDRARLRESEESWIYVTIDGLPGVLTWPNSD